MTTRAALYLRVSTDDQTVDNQCQALEALAKQRGWTIVATYADEGISGAHGREQRPGLDRMLKDASRGKIDVLLAWSVDRLGRSLRDLVGTLGELQAAKVDLVLHQQAVDTTTPAGRALFGMLCVFSEFEREMIRARVVAGMQRARKAGKHLGRRKVGPRIEQAIADQLATGAGILKVARALGVGSSTVQRIRAEMQQATT